MRGRIVPNKQIAVQLVFIPLLFTLIKHFIPVHCCTFHAPGTIKFTSQSWNKISQMFSIYLRVAMISLFKDKGLIFLYV